ncbi:6-phospho-3-hexuloisomerase [Cohnella nanjingensis]|uniref:6-phospho-3-hexuloisomerase n=1 Tax=Cohnella nanjingensis TaxID=1387779 RepID=A0A7X0RLK4_9BACL|nr:6-phospho-3-hexuloisomerase [Cohnella nanjingensis]MBB6669747.1 6-phospho-3-hexuloisomerase [Cohnella nanjingensis]
MASTAGYSSLLLQELSQVIGAVSDAEAAALAERIRRADRIFVAGAGRSGLMMRAFAMRLVHLGLQAHVVGETTTPGFGPRDLLILGSGSGETSSLVAMAQKAAALGGTVALATVRPDSTLGRLAECVVRIPASAKEANGAQRPTIQPMGSLFEQSLLLLLDALTLSLMAEREADSAAMFGRHANLE